MTLEPVRRISVRFAHSALITDEDIQLLVWIIVLVVSLALGYAIGNVTAGVVTHQP